MAKKNLYFIFSSFIHIFRHLVLSQSRKVQEKTAKNKLSLVEKKQERAEKLWDVHEREPVRQANTTWASV